MSFANGLGYNRPLQMKEKVPIRIEVLRPPAAISMQIQRGRDELLPPSRASQTRLVFDLIIDVDLSGETPNFLGPYAQGPKHARFIYVNSGRQAGQQETEISRRAKLSLMGVTQSQLEQVISTRGSRLSSVIEGTDKRGDPVCASVKGIEWQVITK